MSDSDSEHTAEGIGSNSTQSQSQKKHDASGNRKRKTVTDSSASSFIVAQPKFPSSSDEAYEKLAQIIRMNRFPNHDQHDIPEIEQQKGKYGFTRDNVLDMATEIRDFHKNNNCDCIGKYISDLVLPSLEVREEWNKVDELNELISMTCGASSIKRMRTCVADVACSQSSKMRTYEELCAFIESIPEASGTQLVNLMKHYNLPSELKIQVATLVTKNAALIPKILDLKEPGVVAWLESISSRGVFEKWYAEWIARNQS